GQANVDRGHTYLNIDYIDTTLETLNHEIAHHNGLGETSATAMGKISDFAYNIGTSLNTDDINTHRQTITPTEKTLQALTTDEQLAITQDNQALLNANEVQRAWEVESGDGVWDQPGVAQGVGKTRQKDCRKAGVSSSDCSAYIWARSVSRAKNIASILVPTSPEEVAFIVVTAGGGYVLKVAGKAGVKVVRSFKGKDELDKAVAEAKRVSRTDTRAGYEPDNDLLSSQASKKARDEKLIKDAENISTAKPNGRPPQVTAPRNIQEQILWSEVVKNPKTAGKPLNGMNNDSRFPKDAGFQKMEAKMRSNDGKAVVIHYQYNHKTNKAYDIKITSVE
ncbi:hypothetical protein, partial [Moraxella porci]|uniref:hypothetical protein n=1 Tax=Moraxella porci TaxID=1288392 RepID=UPI002449A403